MKRKVIKQRDSYTITLPIKWVNSHGITPQSEVEVNEENEALIIKTESMQKKSGEITLPQNSNERLVIYILTNAYRNGYDILKVKAANKKQIEYLEHNMDTLLGWQTTKKTENEIVIENLTEPSADRFDSLLRRMFHIISDNINSLSDLSYDKKYHEELKKSAKEASMIDNFCRRCISKKMVEKEKTYFYWQFISTVLWVHRSFIYLVESMEKKQCKKDKLCEELLEKIKTAFQNFSEGFFDKDIAKISKVFDITKAISDKKVEYLDSTNKVIVYQLIEMSRMLNLSCSPCLGILV